MSKMYRYKQVKEALGDNATDSYWAEILTRYGPRSGDDYDVFPDTEPTTVYPTLQGFDTLQIDLDDDDEARNAVVVYSSKVNYFKFNMILNLLGKATDPQFFLNLQRACVGGRKGDNRLPAIVYRKLNLSEAEYNFYLENQGQTITIKSFVSTSRQLQVDFGKQIMKINLNHFTNGALDISRLSKFPEEEEILLAAFSRFYIDSVCGDEIIVTYLGYYQFNHSLPSTIDRIDIHNVDQVDRFLLACGIKSIPAETEKQILQLITLKRNNPTVSVLKKHCDNLRSSFPMLCFHLFQMGTDDWNVVLSRLFY